MVVVETLLSFSALDTSKAIKRKAGDWLANNGKVEKEDSKKVTLAQI